MFFNQDVLFKNGPLSLIWMAGNDELRFKDRRGRRNKQYLLMMDSNIIQLCDLVRQQFAEMGTVKGMNLKKVSTLVKGLGVLYLSKMDNLSREMSLLQMRLQVSAAARLHEIDLPKVTRTTTAMLIDTEEMAPFMGFGALEDAEDMNFGVVGFGTLEDAEDTNFGVVQFDVPSSPRANPRMGEFYPSMIRTSPFIVDSTHPGAKFRRKKRKTGKVNDGEDINEENVLKMLQDTVAQNPEAHCLREENLVERGNIDIDTPFDEFNTEFGEQTETRGEAESTDLNGPLEIIEVGHRLRSPPGRLSTSIGRQRTASPSTSGENHPLSQEQIAVPGNELLFPALDGDVGLVPRRGRRRSQRLQIDQETSIPLLEMRKQIDKGRGHLNHDVLRLVMAENQAATRKEFLRSSKGLSHVDKLGRSINGRRLFEFVSHQLESLRKMPRLDPIISIHPIRREDTGSIIDRSQVPSNLAEVSRPKVPIVPISENGNSDAYGLLSVEQTEPENFEHFQVQTESELNFPNFQERNGFTLDIGEVGAGQEFQDVIPPGKKTFQTMFPPGSVSRKGAAVGFFQLIRLQSKNKVELKQEEPYGEIIVTRTAIPGENE